MPSAELCQPVLVQACLCAGSRGQADSLAALGGSGALCWGQIQHFSTNRAMRCTVGDPHLASVSNSVPQSVSLNTLVGWLSAGALQEQAENTTGTVGNANGDGKWPEEWEHHPRGQPQLWA